eukprot:gene5891-9022_t
MQIQRGTKSEGHHDAFLYEDGGSVIRTLPAHTDEEEGKRRENGISYSEVEEQCRISSGIGSGRRDESRLVDDGGFHHQDMIEKVLQDDPSFSPSPMSNLSSSLTSKPRVNNPRISDAPQGLGSAANGNLIHTEVPLNPTHPAPFRAHAPMGGFDHPMGISFDAGYGHSRFYPPMHQPAPHLNPASGPMPFYPPHGLPPHAMCPPDFGISGPMMSHSYPPYAGIYPTSLPHNSHHHHHSMHGMMRPPSTNNSSNGIIIPVMQDNTNRQTICVRALCAAAVVIYQQGQLLAMQQQAS